MLQGSRPIPDINCHDSGLLTHRSKFSRFLPDAITRRQGLEPRQVASTYLFRCIMWDEGRQSSLFIHWSDACPTSLGPSRPSFIGEASAEALPQVSVASVTSGHRYPLCRDCRHYLSPLRRALLAALRWPSHRYRYYPSCHFPRPS